MYDLVIIYEANIFKKLSCLDVFSIYKVIFVSP